MPSRATAWPAAWHRRRGPAAGSSRGQVTGLTIRKGRVVEGPSLRPVRGSREPWCASLSVIEVSARAGDQRGGVERSRLLPAGSRPGRVLGAFWSARGAERIEPPTWAGHAVWSLPGAAETRAGQGIFARHDGARKPWKLPGLDAVCLTDKPIMRAQVHFRFATGRRSSWWASRHRPGCTAGGPTHLARRPRPAACPGLRQS